MTGRHTDALNRVLELNALINIDMEQGLAADGLTASRAHLLWELKKLGPTPQKNLAHVMGVSPRNITGLVDALVATGFVSREPHPTDRRATLVSFTEHGAEIAEKLVAGQQEFAQVLFGDMPAPLFDGLIKGIDELVSRLNALGIGVPLSGGHQ